MRTLPNRFAFTLAEVLITLAIIGVVAAITIPTLMANYQKVQQVAGLKKAYAEITEALKLMANDHGCPDNLGCTGAFTNNGDLVTADTILGNEFKKYFKLAKDCGAVYNQSDESTKCFSENTSSNYDGSGERWDENDNMNSYYTFITADGFSIALSSYDCDTNWVNNEPNLNLTKVCGDLVVDTNGPKGPNNYGRDIFHFSITNGKGPAIYPSGGSELKNMGWAWVDASSGDPQACYDQSLDGDECAARIMEQGWQMKY